MESSPPNIEHDGEAELIAALRARDEQAFMKLVNRYQTALIRLALVYCGSRAVAEEVVQDAWLGVLKGIDTFEGRSSLKTWLFRILVNRARTRAEREARTVPFSAVHGGEEGEPAVPATRFLPDDDPEWPRHWAVPPRSWGASPEADLLSSELLGLVSQAIANLPASQREVITLRDVEGWTPEDVCNVLGITETNHRVLLHRARSRVRAALERYIDPELG